MGLSDFKNNVLMDIFKMYPEVWRDSKRFKALLLDYLPQDKLTRNLLYICLEEGIPYEICEKNRITKIEIYSYKNRLINACGCNESLANSTIMLWLESLGIEYLDIDDINDCNRFNMNLSESTELLDIKKTSITELDLGNKYIKALQDREIYKIEDLISLNENQFVDLFDEDVEILKNLVTQLAFYGVPHKLRAQLNKSIIGILDKKDEWITPVNSIVKHFKHITYLEPQEWQNREKKTLDGIYYYPYKNHAKGQIYIGVSEEVKIKSKDYDYERYINGLCSNPENLLGEEEIIVKNICGRKIHHYLMVHNKKMELHTYVFPTGKGLYVFMFGEKILRVDMEKYERLFFDSLEWSDELLLSSQDTINNIKWNSPGKSVMKRLGECMYAEPQGWDRKDATFPYEGTYYYPYDDASDGMIWISKRSNIYSDSEEDFDYEEIINGLCRNKDDLLEINDYKVPGQSKYKGKVVRYYMWIENERMELRTYIIPLKNSIYGFFFGEKESLSKEMICFEKEFMKSVCFVEDIDSMNTVP